MVSEDRKCQNCNDNFTIDLDDFSFYEKIGVPAPTFCPKCRMQRRMMFRNEHVLYKRKCALTEKNIVTIFSPDTDIDVFYFKDWWGDSWDQYQHGMNYDPARNFFEQFQDLQQKTPWMNLIVDSSLENSDYVNHAGNCKDTYLSFNVDTCENVLYANTGSKARDSLDIHMFVGIELSSYSVNVSGSQIHYSENCDECLNVYFCKECVGCTNCFGCVNLRNKSYYMWNEQFTQQEYEERISLLQLDSYNIVQELREKAQNFWSTFPVKYHHVHRNNSVTGDYVYYSKNTYDSFYTNNAEDSRFLSFMTMGDTKDCYDICEWGSNLELSYEGITVGDETQKAKFCFGTWKGAYNTEYCMMTPGSRNCFGCCNMKKAEYCILNKQYSKEEYFKLRDIIISDMNKNPYVDKKGRVFIYGEFFPYELSMFDYNESWAVDYFPLDKDSALAQGFSWKDIEKNKHKITLQAKDIPDSIHDIADAILQEVLGCDTCENVYRVVAAELQLLRRFGLPIPRQCSSCRHTERLSRINSPRLYKRTTEDGVEVMTAYAPDRPEKIYSEEGYNNLIN